jgi:hypothetical protein
MVRLLLLVLLRSSCSAVLAGADWMHACTVYLCHSEYFISSSDVGPANLHGAIPPAILKPTVYDGARAQRSGRSLQRRSSNTNPSASVDRTCESASRKGGTET